MKYKRIRRQGLGSVNVPKNQSLVLEVTTNEEWDFFAIYDTLGPIQQRIWRCLVNWTKNFPSAFPSQTTIAKKCKCGRQHVNKTISYFKKLGWISLNSRGVRRTKVIAIPTSLQKIDPFNREYFRKIETTSKVTYNYSNTKKFTSRAGEIKKGLEISPWLKDRSYSLDNKRKLSLISCYSWEEAKRIYKQITQNGWVPGKPEKYFVEMALNIAKENREKILWRLYYDMKRAA